MQTSADSGQTDIVDVLHEPVWPIFIYSAWALCSWYVNQWLALVLLVAGTVALAVAAFRTTAVGTRPDSDDPTEQPAFVTDFNVVLLFCGATIAALALLLEAYDRSPALLAAGAAYAACAAIVVGFRHGEHRRLST